MRAYNISTVDVAQVDDTVHLRTPVLELALPRDHSGERHDDDERPVQLVHVVQDGQEADRLNRLTQTHLISQNHAVLPANNHIHEH